MATKINGKNKGSTFERKISNLLSMRFQQHTGLEKSFRRNSDSGSFFGGSNKSRVDTHDTEHAAFGDLICPSTFKFSVECKHYKSAPTFSTVITTDVKQWDLWLAQVDQDSEKSNRSPLLIIKYNNVPELAVVKTKVDGLSTRLEYKGRYFYLLTDFLTQSDTVFFKSPI